MILIRLIVCFIIVAVFSALEPVFDVLFKKTKIFISLNKFLTGSNRICKKCRDHLDLDTNLLGWAKSKCYICSWVYGKIKK